MPLPPIRRVLARPEVGVALATAALRVSIVLHAWSTNPLVRAPQLDGTYYLNWATDIARGDLAGTGGIIRGQPWVLNSLYAYVIAPFAAVLSAPLFTLLVFQSLLGACTAALTASAARRWFGTAGAWTAGLLVAFAAPLAQLDAHVSVAELAAFTVAGSCFACAPRDDGERTGAHGPLAAGLWLGVSALARPISQFAMPFVAWSFARSAATRKLRTAAVVVAAFFACAVPSLLRNGLVSGEWSLYTVAGGINLHLGNNPIARSTLSMVSPHFRFNPEDMYEDGRRFVHEAIGRSPTRSEIGSWFTKTTLEETFLRAPTESFAFYAHKARWFFTPIEVPSSASYATDTGFSPWLRAAFVPTWLTAALALAGLWAVRRRRDVLFGPGAIALSHGFVLTLVFPLSHYRAPAIPALAILAAGAVTVAAAAWREGRRGATGVTVAVAAGAAILGRLPPEPDRLAFRDEAVMSVYWRDHGDLEKAEEYAWRAQKAYLDRWGRDTDIAWQLVGEMQFRRRNWEGAADSFTKALAIDRKNPQVLVFRSYARERLGRYADAEADARTCIDVFPFLPDGYLRLGELLSLFPERIGEARAMLRKGTEMGGKPDPDSVRRVQ